MDRRPRLEPEKIRIETTAFRYASYDTPFWARFNTKSGRWHRAGEGAVQYLSLTPNGAWAELIRAEDLRGEEDVAMVRMPLWAASINQGLIADYSDFAKTEASGFAPDALIDDDWARCQREGDRLRRLGFGGVLAPSAALPGATNLTLFGGRISTTWGEVPDLAAAIPATIVTVGSPPRGLVEHVRFFGDMHTGHDEYRRMKIVGQPKKAPNQASTETPREP